MRQILYVSSKAPGHEVSIGNILVVSRRNNDAAGVTGLLYTDGIRFLQVLEGDRATVDQTFDRIRADPRHHAVVVLSDREVTEREFGICEGNRAPAGVRYPPKQEAAGSGC